MPQQYYRSDRKTVQYDLTMERHVFISYCRTDTAVVDELITLLHNGYACWRDIERITGGQVWRQEISRALDAAYAVILVISPDTQHSKEVYAEYFYALGRNVPVIPLLVADCKPPFGLENVNARIWYNDKRQAVNALCGDLDHYNREAPALAAATPANQDTARKNNVIIPGVTLLQCSGDILGLLQKVYVAGSQMGIRPNGLEVV